MNWRLQSFYDDTELPEEIEANKNIIEFIKKYENEICDGNVFYGTIGSGDCWNNEVDRIELLNEQYEVLGEDMETIAVYKIANQYKIPIIGIRVVSDNVILQEEYDRNLAKKSQMFALSLCRKFLERNK